MADFPYVILPSKEGKEVCKPLIPVVLNYFKTHKITPSIMALIDSGADVCFCLAVIGKSLGIQLNKIKEEKIFITANRTTFKAKPAKINLYVGVGGKQYSCLFYFTDSLPIHTPVILGQSGFFDHHRITFNSPNKKITIT
jgi:hypothetical protein